MRMRKFAGSTSCRMTWNESGLRPIWTPRKYALLPCGHFESAVSSQNDEFNEFAGSFDCSYSRSLNAKT